MANKDTLMGYYEDFGKNDFVTMKSKRFHPDISWTMPGHHPMSGTMKGADSVVAFLKQLYKAGIRVDNVHLGELDDGTLVEKHTGHGKAGEEEFLFPTVTTYAFKDGKIFDVRVHNGDPIAADRFFWLMFKLKGIPDRLAE
jgi:ketosteroid isomerase-like protein